MKKRSAPRQLRRVLIVDDVTDNRDMYAMYLESEIRAELASDGLLAR